MFDIKKVKEEANKQIAEEKATRAKNALVAKLKTLDAARQVVHNVEREIQDLEQAIADGNF